MSICCGFSMNGSHLEFTFRLIRYGRRRRDLIKMEWARSRFLELTHTKHFKSSRIFKGSTTSSEGAHIAYSVNINNNKQTPKKSGVIAEIRVITKTSFSAVIVKNVAHDFSMCCMNWKRSLVGCAFIRQNVPFFSKSFFGFETKQNLFEKKNLLRTEDDSYILRIHPSGTM